VYSPPLGRTGDGLIESCAVAFNDRITESNTAEPYFAIADADLFLTPLFVERVDGYAR
jgi:hypothetical protein